MPTEHLSPTEFRLLGLVITERTGREIAKQYKAETGRAISYGTLYTTLRRMREEGLVHMREGSDGDGRLRYFKIAASGARMLNRSRTEFSRLADFGMERG